MTAIAYGSDQQVTLPSGQTITPESIARGAKAALRDHGGPWLDLRHPSDTSELPASYGATGVYTVTIARPRERYTLDSREVLQAIRQGRRREKAREAKAARRRQARLRRERR